MKLKITEGDWKQAKLGWLTVEGEDFTATFFRFEFGSQYGIDNGRLSKLTIKRKSTNECIANYDRGWDIKPAMNHEDIAEFYNEVLRQYN